MIQIQLKAKHFYFIVYNLKDAAIRQYYSLITKLKEQLSSITDLDAMISVEVPYWNVTNIFRMLTALPEGISASINSEMVNLLNNQISNGVRNEMMNGIIADAEGVLPENAYWQKLAAELTYYVGQNTIQRNSSIQQGYELINNI